MSPLTPAGPVAARRARPSAVTDESQSARERSRPFDVMRTSIRPSVFDAARTGRAMPALSSVRSRSIARHVAVSRVPPGISGAGVAASDSAISPCRLTSPAGELTSSDFSARRPPVREAAPRTRTWSIERYASRSPWRSISTRGSSRGPAAEKRAARVPPSDSPASATKRRARARSKSTCPRASIRGFSVITSSQPSMASRPSGISTCSGLIVTREPSKPTRPASVPVSAGASLPGAPSRTANGVGPMVPGAVPRASYRRSNQSDPASPAARSSRRPR